MADTYQPEDVLNPVPISFAPPDTEGVPIGPGNQTPFAPDGETPTSTKKVNKKSKRSKVNEESPHVSTESRKARKPKTDKASTSKSTEVKRLDWLPEGWTIIERIREGGKTAGLRDKYYFEPGTGKKFRSQVEVRRHLGLFDDAPKPSDINDSPKAMSTGYLGNLSIEEMIDEENTKHEAMRDEELKGDTPRASSKNDMNAPESCQNDDVSSSSSLGPDKAPTEEPNDNDN